MQFPHGTNRNKPENRRISTIRLQNLKYVYGNCMRNFWRPRTPQPYGATSPLPIRGNCTTRGSGTPMTRHQKASCSENPDANSIGCTDAVEPRTETAGSHGRRHGGHPRRCRHTGPAGRAGGGRSPTPGLTAPPLRVRACIGHATPRPRIELRSETWTLYFIW